MSLGEEIVIKKNENYYNAENVKIEGVDFKIITDLSTALTAFENGEVDGINTISPSEILRFENDPCFSSRAGLGNQYYVVNVEKPYLSDARVRRALTLAIDRRAIIDNVMQGGQLPACTLVAPGIFIENEDFREAGGTYGVKETASVEEAKKLLSEAGYPEAKDFPTITLQYYSRPDLKALTEAIQQMWEENLGINVEVSSVDYQVNLDDMNSGNYDIALTGWGAAYAHPLAFLDVFVQGGYNNYAKWNNPEYNLLIAEAKKETDTEKQLMLLHDAEKVLVEESPFIPVYHGTYPMLMKDTISGWRRTVFGYMSFENAAYL